MQLRRLGAMLVASALLLGGCTGSRVIAQDPGLQVPTILWQDHVLSASDPVPDTVTSLRRLTLEAYGPQIERGYYFVQLARPVTSTSRAIVADAGAELLEYVPSNAFLARMSAAARDRVAELPEVGYVGIYQPWMRLPAQLRARLLGLEPEPPPPPRLPLTFQPRDSAANERAVQLTLSVFVGEDLPAVRAAVERSGGTILQEAGGDRRPRFLIGISREDALALPLINGVRWIEEFVLPHRSEGAPPRPGRR